MTTLSNEDKNLKMADMRQSIRAFLSKGNRASWCIFFLFALLIFTKCNIFQWEVYHSFMVSSLWKQPLTFWSFWLPKIGISLFLASWVFFSKRNWWTIIVALFIDTWMLANIIYFRSNGCLFDGFTFTMAGNMSGFWDSLFVYFSAKDFYLYSLTLLFTVLLLGLNKIKAGVPPHTQIGCLILSVVLLLNWFSFALMMQFSMRFYQHDMCKEQHNAIYYMRINPFSYEYRAIMMPMNKNYGFDNFSVVHGFIYVMLDYVHNKYEIEHPYQLTPEEEDNAQALVVQGQPVQNDRLLVILLVESLESWAINETITPNLYHFMETHPTLFAKHLKSQVVSGESSDGQLIVNTGLLPVQQGATCFRYPYITFPSLVNLEDSAVTILTHDSYCWNQDVMSERYGYDITLSGTVEDSILSSRIINYAKRDYKTIQGITIATHTPFSYAHCSSLRLPNDMPTHMRNYLLCLNWTDAGLGVLFDRIDSVPQLRNATIMLTGDHTVFWPDIRNEFEAYCHRSGADLDVQKSYVPLIVYSPEQIKEDIIIEEPCYQMDIYPTIQHLIGADDYYWKGFGVNLLDSTARHNRPCTEEEAYQLSDKLIRSNYFATIDKGHF